MKKVSTKYQEWVSALEDGKNPCYGCRKKGGDKAGDNFHFYGEGNGGYCHVCEYTIPSDETLAILGDNYEEEFEEEEIEMAGEFEPRKVKKFLSNISHNGKGFRGISESINKASGVWYEFDTSDGRLLAQHVLVTENFKPSGLKTRKMPKRFTSLGAVGKTSDLMGMQQHKVPKSKKFVIIVGGEIDKLSADEIQKRVRLKRGNKYDAITVLSPLIGESCVPQLKHNYDYLNQFDQIILCFDNDDAGNKATEKAAKSLPKNKVYVMKMARNDVNCYIWDNDESVGVDYSDEWMNCFWNKEKYTPSGIISSQALPSRMREALKMERLPLPPFMSDLQEMMAGGIPLKSIINMGSASGTGKSTIVDELIYYWIFNSPYKVGIITLEADSAQYGINMLSRHVGTKINLINTSRGQLDFVNQPEIIKKEHELFNNPDGEPRFSLIEDRDSSLDEIKELIMSLIIGLGCRVIVADPLQDLIDGLPLEAQVGFLNWQKGMLKSHDVIFININHIRKSGGGQKANSTGADIFEEDFQGTSNIFKSGYANLLFTRDKEAECPIERNTTYMKASKIRWTGASGAAGEYLYDNKAHTIRNRKAIKGMPIGKPPGCDRDGTPHPDKRDRVGVAGNSFNNSDGPQGFEETFRGK